MAVVLRARDQRLGRVVALKLLAPAMAGDGAFRRRFITESRAAADDLHIILAYEADEAGGVLFIAKRFVVGGDLRRMLEGGERACSLRPPPRGESRVSCR
jgi:serine/threonine protein kinase